MKTVYFIKPIGMDGPIKIGCSAHPDGRRRNLDTWSPFALEIAASIEGDHALERRFHARFVSCHQRREWFNATPELLETIEQINAGQFDVRQLPEPLFVANFTNGKGPKRGEAFSRQMSYSLRASHLAHRTGYACPVDPCDMVKRGDTARIAAVEAFLADPASHGRAIDAPWAAAARAKQDAAA